MRRLPLILLALTTPAAAQLPDDPYATAAETGTSARSIRDDPDPGREQANDPASLAGRGGTAIRQRTFQVTIGTPIRTEIRTEIGTRIGVPR